MGYRIFTLQGCRAPSGQADRAHSRSLWAGYEVTHFLSPQALGLLHCFVFLSPHSSLSHCFVSSSAYSLLLSVWSKDGRTLASGGNDNCVQLWDWQVGDLTKQRQGIRPVIHMPDIAIQARETPMNTITAHQSAVKAVSWCPWQNNVLATAGQTSFTYHSCRSPWRSGGTVDRTVRIWNTASMTQLQSFDTGSQVLLSSCSISVEKLHCSACRFPRSPGTASTRRWSRGTDFRITSLQFGVILGEHRSFILQIDHPIPSNGNTMKCFQVDNLIFSMGKVADLTGHTSRLNYTCWQCLE